jgi:hypothetical protein
VIGRFAASSGSGTRIELRYSTRTRGRIELRQAADRAGKRRLPAQRRRHLNFKAVSFAASILAVGLVYEIMARNMPQGSLAQPGPGFYPGIVGAFLIATALGCFLQEVLAARRRNAAPPAEPHEACPAPQRNVGKTVALAALLAGYAFLLKPLGFALAMFAFVALAINIFGYRKLLPTLAIAALATGISWLVFVVWLKVALPLGILDW